MCLNLHKHYMNVSTHEHNQAKAQFQKVTGAYEFLSDDAARREYDRSGHTGHTTGYALFPSAAAALL